MKGQKLGCFLLTLVVTILIGTFFAILPISITASVIDLRRFDLAHQSLIGAIWIWVKVFCLTTYAAYVFGLVLGLPATLTVATSLSIVGAMKNSLPFSAAIIAFVISFSLGVFLEWRLLYCQCSRDLAEAVHVMPAVYLTSYIFLAFGTWLIMRPIWRKANAL
jgi:hypothetical protein